MVIIPLTGNEANVAFDKKPSTLKPVTTLDVSMWVNVVLDNVPTRLVILDNVAVYPMPPVTGIEESEYDENDTG